MSRGLGDTQRALLTELAASEDLAFTTAELAALVHRNPRQVRTAVASLVRRGLLVTTREAIGWKGSGEYGSLTFGFFGAFADDEPDWPQGMPTFGLRVWLPVNRARYLVGECEAWVTSLEGWASRHNEVPPEGSVAAGRARYAAMTAACELAGVPRPEWPEWLGTEP